MNKDIKRLLVVVDYQNDFVSGTLGFSGAELIDKGIAEKITEYTNDTHSKIIVTLDTHTAAYLETREGKQLPIQHCVEGTLGHKLYGEVGELIYGLGSEVLHIYKSTFGISPLSVLKVAQDINTEIESIEIVGLVTNMCVISNAVVFQSQYPNAQIIVDASLCDSFDKELHSKALDTLEGMQVKVINR